MMSHQSPSHGEGPPSEAGSLSWSAYQASTLAWPIAQQAKRTRAKRACKLCMEKRRRCELINGDLPCKLCAKKGIACRYPSPRELKEFSQRRNRSSKRKREDETPSASRSSVTDEPAKPKADSGRESSGTGSAADQQAGDASKPKTDGTADSANGTDSTPSLVDAKGEGSNTPVSNTAQRKPQGSAASSTSSDRGFMKSAVNAAGRTGNTPLAGGDGGLDILSGLEDSDLDLSEDLNGHGDAGDLNLGTDV